MLSLGKTSAQTYVVYKIAGKVMQKGDFGDKPVQAGAKLSGSTKVVIPYEGSLQVIDAEKNERYTLQTPGTASISTMIADNRNKVGKLTKQYINYMIEQVVSGGKAIASRHSDVATVTRELQKTEKPKTDDAFSELVDEEWDLEGEFDQFVKSVNAEWDAFRDEVNREYAEFIKDGWKNFEASPGKPKPADEHVLPLKTEKNATAPTNSFFRKHKKVVEVAVPSPQPTPYTHIQEQQTEVPDPFKVKVMVWGTEFSVRFDPANKFQLVDLSPNSLSAAWMQLSDKRYNNLIRDCMDLRFEKHLGDWAYLQVLKQIAIACQGEGNEATMLMAYVYCQSGYRMRLCRDGQQLFMLYGSEHYIYDKDYFYIDNLYFYPFDFQASNVSICNVPYPNERSLSLYLTEQQQLDFDPSAARTVKCERYPDIQLTYTVNKHLIDFYNKYPSSTVNDDFMTRWAMYANTPMESEVADALYSQLRKKLEGLSEVESVNRLLNWIQTGFEYKYDEEVWGADRPFFAEETLFYPYCDCEDRSILLSRLIRDLLGLKCVLIYYPGHLAMGVHLSENIPGTYYMLDNERYYVCDPTIIGWGAPVGEPMDQFMDCAEVSLILLENKRGE